VESVQEYSGNAGLAFLQTEGAEKPFFQGKAEKRAMNSVLPAKFALAPKGVKKSLFHPYPVPPPSRWRGFFQFQYLDHLQFMGFLSEKFFLSVDSANRENQVWPRGPMPGQKIIRLVKKGGGSSFLNAGIRRFSPVIPLPPRLFAETRQGELRRFLPALFVFDACFFARATKKRV
jgi:hypothetical protein